MEEKKTSPGWFIFVMLTALVLLSAWLYTGWQSSQRVLPSTLSIADLPMGGMTREQALNALAEAYTSPLTIYYEDETILLVPEMVDLMLDTEATAANLDEVLLSQSGLRGFFNYMMAEVLRQEVQSQKIQPILSYSRERLDAFLERTAQQYDHPPLDAVPLPEAGTFRPPEPGRKLNIEASRPLLIEALLSPTQKEMQLVVETEGALPASMAILQQAIEGQFEGFTGIAGVFVKDLPTGRELCYNCDTLFSGLSPLKIAAALAFYRQVDTAPDPQTATVLDQLLTGGDAIATSPIFSQLGDGDPYVGAQTITNLVQGIGLEQTVIAAPYERPEGTEIPFEPPQLPEGGLDTEPDPYIRTTPLEMGLLLEGMEQCRTGGGVLRLHYPQEITPAECEDAIASLRQNGINKFLATEMPQGTQVAYKHGWQGATHAEAAIVYTPKTTFVLSVYLYQPEWLIGEESAPTFAAVGQLAYRFLNAED